MNYSENVWRFLVESRHMKTEFERGSQRVFRFPNGFGASVVKRVFSGGLSGTYGATEGRYELAVLAFSSEDSRGLTYETPITNDVLGWLTPDEVEAHLQAIANLWVV